MSGAVVATPGSSTGPGSGRGREPGIAAPEPGTGPIGSGGVKAGERKTSARDVPPAGGSPAPVVAGGPAQATERVSPGGGGSGSGIDDAGRAGATAGGSAADTSRATQGLPGPGQGGAGEPGVAQLGGGAGPRQSTRRGPGTIRITSPRDGLALSPEDPPIVIVEGQVEDPDLSTVWLVTNGHRVEVAVRDGRFSQPVPVLERVSRLWAETRSNPGAETVRSQEVTVNNNATGTMTVLAMEPAAAGARAQMNITASWRPRSDRFDDVVNGITVKSFAAGADAAAARFFYFRHSKPGVYNFVVRDRSSGPMTEVRGRLYHLVDGRLDVRDLKPVVVGGSVTVVVTRMLLPYGVLWDQDEWFTGRSEGSDTITKFRFPEGINWTERKAGLR